jgi:hypothetical protein
MDDYENEEHNQNRNAFNAKERSKIAKWLTQFNVTLPKAF